MNKKNLIKYFIGEKNLNLIRRKLYSPDSSNKFLLNKNLIFRDTHLSERCFILGNGPSIKEVDFKLLKNEITFTVNQIPRMANFNELNSNYHLWADERFFDINEDSKADMELLDVMLGVNTEDNKPVVFYKLSAKSMIEKFNMHENLNINYYYSALSLYKGFNERITFENIVPMTSTVVHDAIMLAIYMGFKKIYLLGCDSSGFITTAQAKLEDMNNLQYAYEISENEKERIMKVNNKHSIEDELRFYVNIFENYRIIDEYCKKNGIKLLNCSKGGLLEDIERANFEDVINKI